MRTLDLIEYVVARPDGVVAQDIAAVLAIPVSSLSYLLATLVERDYLRREGRLYFAGAGLVRLRDAPSYYSLVDRAKPLVRALRKQLNETATLFVRIGWEVEAVYTESTDHPLRYSIEQGTRAPLHSVAAGKIMLAAMTEEMLAQYVAEAKLARFTAFTICKNDMLLHELEEVRRTGIAAARNEYTNGITALSIGLRDGGEVQAALSVAVPSTRMDNEVEAVIRDQLRKAAASIDQTGGSPV